MKKYPFWASMALLLSFFACQTGARALYGQMGRPSDPVPFMQSARTGVLPSGLRYYILENSMPAGRAFLTLAVDAGSVLETEEERGLAHFVEHMAFNGTERFPEAELVNYLRSLGMRFGPDVNAHTSFDETVYRIEVPVEVIDGQRRIPDTALAVIDDWSRAVTFFPEAVDNERLVMIEEHRTRSGASERVFRQMMPLIFRGSPYADRHPIGLLEVLETAAPERLEGFYRRWYRPDNMALIFVGDFDGALLEAMLQDHFHIAAAEGPLYRPRFSLPEPERGSFNALVQIDPELTQARVDLYFKQRNQVPRNDLASYRDGLIDYLSHTMLSFRFDEARSDPQTPYVWAGSGIASYGLGSSFYIFAAQAKAGLSRALVEELLTTKESLSQHGFTEPELDMAKRAAISYIEQLVAEKDNQNSNYYVRAFTRHFLDGDTVPDIEWELAAINQMLPGITLGNVNRRVRAYFADNDLTVFISAPESEGETLPSEDEIRLMAANIRGARIAPYVPAIAASELLDRVPLPGEIISEAVDSETGAVRWRLSNGMEVILKETTNRNNEISFHAQARGGTMNVSEDIYVSAFLAAEMLNASGLGPHSRPELTRILADKQVSFSIWSSNFLRGFEGTAATGDIRTLMEMIYLGFTEARLDPDVVSILLDQRRTRLIQEEANPDRYFLNERTRTIFGNPRFHPFRPEDLERVRIEDALDFIRRSQNPQDYTLVFVGNIDLAVMRSLAETYLASIPAESLRFNEWTDMDYQRPGSLQRELRRGIDERSIVYMGWYMPQAFSDEASAIADVLSEYLDIALTDEIRESLGGVYSISSWVSLSPLPRGELSGGIYFVSSPDRAVELSLAAEAKIREIAQGNINLDTLSNAREALIQAHEQAIQSNSHIAQSYSNSAVIFGSPLSRLDIRPQLQQAVTARDIQDAAVRLLENGPVRLILYPEGWM